MSSSGGGSSSLPKPYSRPPSRAGSPEIEDSEAHILAALRNTILSEKAVDNIMSHKGSERTTYVRNKVLTKVKNADTIAILQKLFPPLTPKRQKMQIDTEFTPTRRRIASPSTQSTQIPPTLPPLNPTAINVPSASAVPKPADHAPDSVAWWKKALNDIPGLPYVLIENIPYYNDKQAAALVKLHQYQLTDVQFDALRSLLPILNDPRYMQPDPTGEFTTPLPPLRDPSPSRQAALDAATGQYDLFGPGTTGQATTRRSRSITPEMERSMRRSPARIDDDQLEYVGSQSDEEEESDDEEMEDAEEEQEHTPSKQPSNKPWTDKTPAEYAQQCRDAVAKLMNNKDLPQDYLVAMTQSIYDAVKSTCKTRRFTIQDEGQTLPLKAGTRSQSRGRSRDKKDPKKDLAKEQARIKKQLLDTLKHMEQFEKDLSFLSKPEIIDLAAKKAAAPPTKEAPKRDPKNPWGKGSSLVKGIKANTIVLNHHEEMHDDIDTQALQTSLQQTCGDNLKVNRVAIAKSGAVVVETAKPMDHPTKKKLQQAVNRAAFGGRDATSELVRPTFSSLKFDFIPTRFADDGSEMSAEDVTNCIRAHPKWEKIEFTEVPRLIPNKNIPGIATVLCKVADDDQGSVAKGLLRTLVRFGPELRRCKEWFNKPPTKQCSICQRWGHTAYNCRARSPYCAVCAEPHPTAAHTYSCRTQGCSGTRCTCDVERCINCNGAHGADSNTCPFWLAKNSPTKMKELLEQKKKDRPTRGSSDVSKAKGKRPASFRDPSTSA